MAAMAIVIEDEETETLLEQVSSQTGESVASLVREALRSRLLQLDGEEVRRRRAAIHEIQERVAAMPVLDARPDDEILGYNEYGHFD